MIKSVQVLIGEVVSATQAAIMPTVLTNLAATTGTQPLASVINYQYGHEKEISSKISLWAQEPEKMFENFPLVWLREDLRYGKDGDFQTVTIPSIIIAWCTDPNYESSQREVQSFNPVLRPIYLELLRQLVRKKEFRIYDPLDIYQTVTIERKFWGTPEDSQAANVFNGHVDAIEIVNLELTLEQNCLTEIN